MASGLAESASIEMVSVPNLTQGHSDKVNNISLSNDGRFAVSASSDQTLKVWDVITGQELRTLLGHRYSVNNVALSTDGVLAVSFSEDKTFIIWDVMTGRNLRTIKARGGMVQGVLLNADGRLAISGDANNATLKVWDVTTGKMLYTNEWTYSDRLWLESSTWGKVMSQNIFTDWERTLKVWDGITGRKPRTLSEFSGLVRCTALSADKRMAIAIESKNAVFKSWETTEDLRITHTLQKRIEWLFGVLK